MDTILNKLERHCGIGACLGGDVRFAQATMNEAKAEIERLLASQEHLKSAIEFAHSEGFQWPSDPMQEFAVTAAICETKGE